MENSVVIDYKVKDGVKFSNVKYKPKTFQEFKALCDDLSINLGDIDTSLITEFYGKYNGLIVGLFEKSTRTDYSGIENWDTSNVTDMQCVFYRAIHFNQDISKWNTSKVTNMYAMFLHAISFNQDISSWDVSNVEDMYYIFYGATNFNQNISNWDVSKVKYHEYIASYPSGLFNNRSEFMPPKFRF